MNNLHWRSYFIVNESQKKQYLWLTVLLCSVLARLTGWNLWQKYKASNEKNLICKKMYVSILISRLYNFTLEFHIYRDGLISTNLIWKWWKWNSLSIYSSVLPTNDHEMFICCCFSAVVLRFASSANVKQCDLFIRSHSFVGWFSIFSTYKFLVLFFFFDFGFWSDDEISVFYTSYTL